VSARRPDETRPWLARADPARSTRREGVRRAAATEAPPDDSAEARQAEQLDFQ
jgi:hypothetical protein